MIICFSGTGNTLSAANRLSTILGLEIFMLEGESLTKPKSVQLEPKPDELIIWAFPVYSWGVPPVVADFIMKFRHNAAMKQSRHYMLATCGDDMGQTDRQWRRLMAARGFNAAGAFSVIMPNTYVCMKGFDVDSPEVVRRKLDASSARIEAIAKGITEGGADILDRGSFAWIKSRIIYPWFVRHSMSPQPFHSTDKCVGCGLCSRLCPMDNIEMEKNRNGAAAPRWDNRCAMCLRCYHACPYHAVAYGNKTEGKGRQWLGLK